MDIGDVNLGRERDLGCVGEDFVDKDVPSGPLDLSSWEGHLELGWLPETPGKETKIRVQSGDRNHSTNLNRVNGMYSIWK